MKKIGITTRLVVDPTHGEVRDALDIRWTQLFEYAKLIPITLPSHYNNTPQLIEALSLDGILFTGGNNLSCFSDDPLSQLRDRLEEEVLTYAIAQHLPVVGICRGMQLIAKYFGALITTCHDHVKTEHTLTFSTNSRNGELLRDLKTVNSFHNFAITQLPPELKICACASDKTIEALEHQSLPIFACMWHPERVQPFNPVMIHFLKTFFGVGS